MSKKEKELSGVSYTKFQEHVKGYEWEPKGNLLMDQMVKDYEEKIRQLKTEIDLKNKYISEMEDLKNNQFKDVKTKFESISKKLDKDEYEFLIKYIIDLEQKYRDLLIRFGFSSIFNILTVFQNKKYQNRYMIIVNNQERMVYQNKLNYEEIVALISAFNDEKLYTVTFQKGAEYPQGEIKPGDSVEITDGTIFNVVYTGQG